MTAVDTELKTVSHWIGGKLVSSKSGRSGVIWNPATGEAQSHVDFASVQDVDEAVANAQNAYPAWRAMPLSRRSEILFRIRGKPIPDTLPSESSEILHSIEPCSDFTS
jgi:malonate-semialdehyde dehydrogenase (acetylating)/methylmalonate-semialdehyde dehydrogenase